MHSYEQKWYLELYLQTLRKGHYMQTPFLEEPRGSTVAQSIPSDYQSPQFGDCRSSGLNLVAWLP